MGKYLLTTGSVWDMPKEVVSQLAREIELLRPKKWPPRFCQAGTVSSQTCDGFSIHIEGTKEAKSGPQST